MRASDGRYLPLSGNEIGVLLTHYILSRTKEPKPLAGVHDVLAKSKGSSNPHNVVKATFDALSKMRDAYTVAQYRGIPLSKVFNG